MSLEEKAKAYDGNYKVYTELINRLENVKEAIKKQNYGIAMDILCKPYPQFQVITHSELKESEDEKIRKYIISSLNALLYTKGSQADKERNDAIAWLEKQSEKGTNGNEREIPFLAWNEEDENIRKELLNHLKKASYGKTLVVSTLDYKRWADWLEKQGKQKPKKCMYSDDNYTDKERKVLCDGCEDECELRQKPAWSEEDEKMLNSIISSVTASDAIDGTISVSLENYEKKIEWLKSLRPQPNQEWSEEDKKMLQSILDEYKSMPTEKRNWLKSIKERYTWKPSDKQMGVLLSEVSAWTKGCPKQIVLESLYNDLKKLREE